MRVESTLYHQRQVHSSNGVGLVSEREVTPSHPIGACRVVLGGVLRMRGAFTSGRSRKIVPTGTARRLLIGPFEGNGRLPLALTSEHAMQIVRARFQVVCGHRRIAPFKAKLEARTIDHTARYPPYDSVVIGNDQVHFDVPKASERGRPAV